MASERSCEYLVDPDSPRVVTTGGNFFPPQTQHNEISNYSVSPCPTQQLAHVDWLGFTINISDMDDMSSRDIKMWTLLELLPFGEFCVYKDRNKGWFGYRESFDIDYGSGILAFGGEHQKNTLHIELTAKGCSAIKDWTAFKAWLERVEAKLTRVDLAHDDHEGRSINLELCKRWLDDGLFSCGKRESDKKLIDDLGTGKGSTLYVGKRGNGKCFRGYEKGKQLGDKFSTWFRAEVEWRAKDRVIPYEILTSPGIYLAGSFPALGFLSAVQNRIKTMKKAVQVSIDHAVLNAKQAVGKLVNVLSTNLSWSSDQIVQTLIRDGIPGRLLPFDKHLSLARGAT